ncbi:hypothetical protein [Phenylobacterium sp.]|uniref:hypothetical protein n=1 Tax=Phenylobacterium sp. TaxID=1871053 RepID=UPI0027305147|nr:hypothetical protein [Phenylobacterium sp.]MDP1875914.1 hypothetical protein [Phenylobacterium sp.]
MGAKLKPFTAEAVITPDIVSPESALWSARLASPSDLGAESPALRLQDHLRRSLEAAPQDNWSARRTLAFVVVSCGAFWAATALLFQLTARALG